MADEIGREANAGGNYDPNNFEWRFHNSMKDHHEKLDALSPEQRKEFESRWREKFAGIEQRRSDYLNDFDNFSFEGMTALIEKEETEIKEAVDEAYGQSRAEKLRDDLRAKMKANAGQERPHENDRER
jgi:hypothetical protein